MKEWVFEFTGRVKKHSELYAACADEFENALRDEEEAQL
jgi:hypothetical protein